MAKLQFQVRTFPATKEGDKEMEEWLNDWGAKNVIQSVHTTLITEDEFKERGKDAKKVEEKMQVSKIQVIIQLK